MGYIVRMPQLGMTMEEGVVVEWPVGDDEEFAEGDVIAIVESEKTTNDVEAREDGCILERFVDLDEAVGPGDPIAYVGEPGESVPDDLEVESDEGDGSEAAEDEGAEETTADDETAASATTSEATTAAAGSVEDAKISPRARSYARENDIDEARLAGLTGSGPDGAVIEADVVAAADSLTGGTAASQTAIPQQGALSGDVTSVSGRDIYEERGGAGLRRTIAQRMTESAKSPQVTLNRRVPVDSLLDIKEQLAEDRDLDLSVTDFVLAAVTEALGEHPELNGIYEDGVHKLARNVNVGIAIDIEDGLVTPVIKGAGRRTMTELREERQRLVSLAQSGEYTMDDLSDGTFTVTNLGHFGVESFDPILNPPQVGILGVCDISSRYDPETEETVREIGLSLTFDHRAVDGADGARFLDSLADALGHPLRLVSFGRQPQPTSDGPFLETDAGPEGDRTATAESTGGMQATVRSRHFEWRADEPEEAGGEDTAPSPVEQFVGSLSSCLTLMIGHMADRRGVDIEEVNVTSQASPPEGRIERIETDIDVVSAESAEDVERVVQMAERACYVNQVIDDDIDRDIETTIRSP
ncbi:2-oxo acid dehydrogenase subunit E2 [Halomicroarcula sp. GCM10025324]|uniref:2-oxo acid dehydrogenase subunit E2 n=1 Tax=Haloarcula TaxID=2237 RepID=UPI0023E7F2FF|nr:2-oxo acid dehydrogenase subunit E2 [Halomicroarcula sp. ZS-22-S1]